MNQLTKITSKNVHLLKDKYYIHNLDLSLSGYVNGAPGTQCLNVIYVKGEHKSTCTHVPDMVDMENLYSTFSSEAPTQLSPPTTICVNRGVNANEYQPHRSERLWPDTPKIDYRFGEDKYVDELKTYIDATYGAHYAGKIGPMDILLAGGQALGFIVGSIIKYAFRLGKKDNYKRDDVLKIAHYAILLLHTYDVLKLGDKKNG